MTSTSTRALWYLTRGAGVVSLLLLTTVVVLGVLSSVRWARPGWPRFASQQLHRNVSMLAVSFVVVHVITAVTDPFAPLRITDAVVPFLSRYRPIWVGLGAVAFDLLIALVVTSLLRSRLGLSRWRALHWLAYACWPVAVLHGLGTGSDVRQPWFEAVTFGCIGAVVTSVWVRVAHRWPIHAGRRAVAALASVAVPAGMFAFAAAGPLKPGWARRAGTPLTLLGAATGSTVNNAAANANTASTQSLTALPSTARFTGTVKQTVRADGTAAVGISGRLSGGSSPRLTVDLYGQPLSSGGVALTSSHVVLQNAAVSYVGAVTGLEGDVITADLRGGGGALQLQLAVSLSHGIAEGSARLTPVAS